MAWRDRNGNLIPGDDGNNRITRFCYGTRLGRAVVSILVRPGVSKAAGRWMDSRVSRLAIRPFIRKHAIPMAEYEERAFCSFNDFFTRRVREGARPVDREPTHLIAPCDSKCSVYPIGEDARFCVKQTAYTLAELLEDPALAARFTGGVFLLFRLTVGDYHRYCYIDNGTKGENIHIPGVFYTVQPAANDRYPIYKKNTREYTLLESENFGTVLMMEVGATMVGRIVNEHGAGAVKRGQEKGRFEFGGSTVIVCLQKGCARIDEDLLANTRSGDETVVKYGEKIGIADTV